MSKDLLPDSRAQAARFQVPTQTPMGWMVPVYCASCGMDCGLCPLENMTFIFILCNDCFKKWGHLTLEMQSPDDEFRDRLHVEQIETYGRTLEPEELDGVASANTTPLAALLREGRKRSQ